MYAFQSGVWKEKKRGYWKRRGNQHSSSMEDVCLRGACKRRRRSSSQEELSTMEKAHKLPLMSCKHFSNSTTQREHLILMSCIFWWIVQLKVDDKEDVV